jgi:Sulfotransferase family
VSRASSKLLDALARGLARAMPERMAQALHDPVFFIGSGRSGTNLFAGLLRSHPELSVLPNEANDLWHPGLYPWMNAEMDVAPIWADSRGFARASLGSRTPADDRRLRATFGAFQRLTGGRYLINKSIMITFIVDHILSLFPDARFIHVLRDGRSVALSFAQKDVQKIARDRARYARHGLDLPFEELVLRFARYWQEQMQEIDRHRELLSGRLIEIRYEELCAEPRRELVKLSRFLSIDPNRFALPERSIASQDHKFTRDLPDHVQENVTAILATTLREKGYVN